MSLRFSIARGSLAIILARLRRFAAIAHAAAENVERCGKLGTGGAGSRMVNGGLPPKAKLREAS